VKQTKQVGSSSNAFGFYSEGIRFESPVWHRLSRLSFISWLIQSIYTKVETVPQIMSWLLPSKLFPIHYSLLPCILTLRVLSYWESR
jgi:hypothetical protein